MARKKNNEILDAEFVNPILPEYPPTMTPEEIRKEQITRECLVKAHLEHIETLGPDEAFSEIQKMTNEIQHKILYRILERENWLSSPNPNIRAEAQNFMTAMLDQSARITHTVIELWEALGMNERKGVLPGGGEVPRLLIPARTTEDFEAKYGEPKGNA